MKNKTVRTLSKVLSFAGAALLTAGMLIACGSPAAEGTAGELATAGRTESAETDTQVPVEDNRAAGTAAQTEVKPDTAAELNGNISMSGSTSMEKLSNAVAESFMQKYPNVTVTPEFTGSSAGIEAVAAGSVDIGNSSRELKESEKEAGVIENIVAIDGIAVVVDPGNTVTGLTKEQLISIYKGETKNWSEVGGADTPIVVAGREAGSGTRGAFEEILEMEDACAYASELDSTGAVMAKVAATPGAIGYVSLDVVDDTVKALALDGIEATPENIKAGAYFLSRPFVMATKGEIEQQNELVQELFRYLESDEGQAVITGVGLILPE